jgi:hypothetical protein
MTEADAGIFLPPATAPGGRAGDRGQGGLLAFTDATVGKELAELFGADAAMAATCLATVMGSSAITRPFIADWERYPFAVIADTLYFQIRSPQLVSVTPNLVSSADSSTLTSASRIT